VADSDVRAVLFDVDGTLTDTSYLHTLAWRRAFLAEGFDVVTARVHRMIGAASGVLMRELVGEEHEGVKAAWRREFTRLQPEIRPVPGARRLLERLRDAGVEVVLASSSEPEDVEASRAALRCDDLVSATTSAADVAEAKPRPDVFAAALERVGADATHAVAVGDAIWDVQAAANCGLGCVGVLTGGVGRAELESAGALAVYDDVGALADDLERSPLGGLLAARD
jgi:HAD superfamily hydrolase (TIGR01509 family)